MNSLKLFTVAIARSVVKHGIQVANETIGSAENADLPGITSLRKTLGHLAWHADELAKQSDPTAIYAPTSDLKNWAIAAFVDANAVEEGSGRASQLWSSMWTEIGDELARMPAKIVATVAAVPGQIFEAATGFPSWVLWVGGAVAFIVVGFGVWKILMIAAPVATKTIVNRYLP